MGALRNQKSVFPDVVSERCGGVFLVKIELINHGLMDYLVTVVTVSKKLSRPRDSREDASGNATSARTETAMPLVESSQIYCKTSAEAHRR
jgi:hypothetical protein